MKDKDQNQVENKMADSLEQIAERTKNTKEWVQETRGDVKDIKQLLAVKVVEDEKKFGERPTRSEIYKKTSIALVVLGLMVTIFFGAIKVAAMLGF